MIEMNFKIYTVLYGFGLETNTSFLLGRKLLQKSTFSLFSSIDIITLLSIYLSVMIVFFITFDLFSSTPAPEDGSWSWFGYGGSRGRGSCHGWWGDWWQTLNLPALGDVKIAEIECHEQLKRRCVKRCSHSKWAPHVMLRQKQPSILLVWLRLQVCEVFQDGGTMLLFLCSCQLSENSQIS